MTAQQKRNFLILLAISLVYFLVMAIPNNQGAADGRQLSINSQDEGFQYPFLMRLLTPGADLKETLTHIVSYHHYIYGYPFYVASASVSLPLRILWGDNLANHTQVHLLILRQFISVLPMIASILILVYLQTRFRSTWRSLGLFFFLALIPGVVRQNITWWHPDALAIFFAMMVFFFLDRDEAHFKKNFYLAAVFCGLSAGTKLVGFFFFLVIAGYLVFGVTRQKIRLRQAFAAGILFILVLLATVVITNPLLLVPQTRAEIIKTHLSHNQSFRTGWDNPDSYNRDPLTWLPVIERWYGGALILGFALASLAVSCILGEQKRLNRQIFLWALPLSLYLLFAIAVRPDHYWMPVFLPLFSSVFNLVDIEKVKHLFAGKPKALNFPAGISLIALLMVCGAIIANLQKDIPLYLRAVQQNRLLLACDANSINTTDGQPVETALNSWYAVEEFDQSQNPPFRAFYAIQGQGLKTAIANPTHGILAWACQDQDSAVFRSTQKASDYKLSHPAARVIGPSGSEIIR